MTLWIDAESNVLRRVELPTDGLRRILEQNAEVKSLSLTLELEGARLNGPIDPTALRFEVPADARIVSVLMLPEPMSLLGKPVPELTFTDLDGKPVSVTPGTCSGKATVLICWATWCGPCKEALPRIEEAYKSLRENPDVQFFAVNVDEAAVPSEEIRRVVDTVGVTFSVVRDTQDHVLDRLLTGSIPTLVIIGPKGNVQSYSSGIPKEVAPQLISDVGAVLGGEQLFTEQLQYYQRQIDAYVKKVEAARAEAVHQLEAPRPDLTRSEIAPRSQPANFPLKTLWSSAIVKNPGNVLVTHHDDGPSRIFVIDGWKGVAEFSAGGEVTDRIPFEIPENGIVGILNEYTDPSGAKFFVGTAGTQRQCYVFDSGWKTVLAYPEDGLSRPGAASISDARLLKVPGSTNPALCVAYWERPVVEAVSLQGEAIWTAETEHPILGLASTEPEIASLVGATRRGTAVVLNSSGSVARTVQLDQFFLQWIIAADLNLDGRMEYAGISARVPGELDVIGFTLDGTVSWRHPLPKGMLSQPIAPILVGRLEPDGDHCWVVPGADGSLRFIDAKGRKLDEFNYGAELAGFAATAIDGKTVFIVSSPDGVEALVISQ
jgi:thiol-disulfide isomerase/thioredoxin